jgi:cell division inhibitor SulA
MSIPLNEEKIRAIIEELRQTDPNITIEEVIKKIRSSRESQGLQWNEDLERKVRYCIQINPN